MTFAPIWATLQSADTPWHATGMSNCYGAAGEDGIIGFDLAISNIDDLSSAALAYQCGNYYYCVVHVLAVNCHVVGVRQTQNLGQSGQ